MSNIIPHNRGEQYAVACKPRNSYCGKCILLFTWKVTLYLRWKNNNSKNQQTNKTVLKVCCSQSLIYWSHICLHWEGKKQQLGVMRMSPLSVISLWADQSINRPWICCQHSGLSLVTFQRSTLHSLQGHCSQTHKQGDDVPHFFSAPHFHWPPLL